MGLFGQSKKELQQEISKLRSSLLPEHNTVEYLNKLIEELEDKKKKLEIDYNNENSQLNKLRSEINQANDTIAKKKKQIYDLDIDIEMQEFGIYKPTYKFANSDQFKEKLKSIRDEQKQMIKNNTACTANMGWTVNGNKAQGNKMVKDMQKLLLRSFNLECDNIIENITVSNFQKSCDKIRKSAEQISKLGTIMSISITKDYITEKCMEAAVALDFEEVEKGGKRTA